MKTRSLSIVVPLVAAAAAMAGVYTYHRFGDAGSGAAVSAGSSAQAPRSSQAPRSAEAAEGFSFHDSPQPLPEVPFMDGEGRGMTLHDFRGKVILVNLWATWCVPCREEMPTLDNLQKKLGGEDFQVVALSIDQEGIPAVKDFYQELGLDALDIYVDDRMRSPSLLNVIGIPATLLVDREGRELGRKLGPAEWDSPRLVEQIRAHL